MSIILPTAPANFYTPSLNTLKNDLEEINGSTKGQITLLTAAPDDVNTAWSEVGAGNKDLGNVIKGSLVAGQAPITLIVGPSPQYQEGTSEFGYKLEFAKIPDVLVEIGSTDSILIVGFALIIGRDNFSQGTNDDVRYIAKLEDAIITDPITNIIKARHAAGIQNISVEDGELVELPEWSIIINYAEPIT